MKVYEILKNMSIDEIATYIDKYFDFDDAPYIQWWDENYCKKCPAEEVFVPAFNKKMECSWCELHCDKCKFFPDMVQMPDNKQIIKMWLESEVVC